MPRWSTILLLSSAGFSLACAGLFRHDHDKDGYTGDVDCDDENAAIHPDAVEVCDDEDVDEDCNGVADDQDPKPGGLNLWYGDHDGDTYGDRDADTVESCDPPTGFGPPEDCNDQDATIHPGASETCNAVDENCDGEKDENPTDGVAVYVDEDNDGFGTGSKQTACDAGSGFATDDGDCDDTDRDVNPDAFEKCNGVDDDCDGDVDDADADVNSADAITWYQDRDGDGWGDEDSTQESCNKPSGYVTDAGDCDDGDAGVNPDATEICTDGIDQNCDGAASECGWGADVDSTEAGATFTSSTGEGLGMAVARIPDVDGDGVDDLAIADQEDESLKGSVSIWTGTPKGAQVNTSASGRIIGNDSSEHFGARIAAGDLNGDGLGDLAVLSTSADASISNTDVVYLFDSFLSQGLDKSDATAYRSNSYTTFSITDIRISPDLTGDGLDDLLVATDGGTGLLYAGPIQGQSTLSGATTTFTSGWPIEVGRYICPAGDVNGDGNEDLLIGATGNASGAPPNGSLFLVLGPVGKGTWLDGDADGLRVGPVVNANTGACAPGGDVNGDGYADTLTRADTFAYGSVYLVKGPWSGYDTLTNADATFSSSVEYLGFSTDATGDSDGDGRADLLMSGGKQTGPSDAAYVFLGTNFSGVYDVSDADVRFHAPADARYFGASSAWVDADGDALSDALIGDAEPSFAKDGRAFLFYAGGY